MTQIIHMDKATEELVKDLEKIMEEAKDKQFHDFENDRYAFPKKVLVEKLQDMIINVKAGKYDN